MKYAAILLLCLTLIATGCVSGPLRYKTLGNHTYGTVEFTKMATPIAKPVAAVAGLITDAGLIATDTIITPIISIPYSIIGSASFGTFGMGNNHGIGRGCLASVLIPYVMYELGYGNIDPPWVLVVRRYGLGKMKSRPQIMNTKALNKGVLGTLHKVSGPQTPDVG